MPHHPSHRPTWTGNQKVLLAVSALFGLLLLFGIIKALLSGSTGMDIAAGTFCHLIFTAPFALALALSRHKAHRARRRNRNVSTRPQPVPHGFPEITITDKEHLPRICVCCGEPGSRTTPIRHRAITSSSSPYEWRRLHPLLMLGLA